MMMSRKGLSSEAHSILSVTFPINEDLKPESIVGKWDELTRFGEVIHEHDDPF